VPFELGRIDEPVDPSQGGVGEGEDALDIGDEKAVAHLGDQRTEPPLALPKLPRALLHPPLQLLPHPCPLDGEADLAADPVEDGAVVLVEEALVLAQEIHDAEGTVGAMKGDAGVVAHAAAGAGTGDPLALQDVRDAVQLSGEEHATATTVALQRTGCFQEGRHVPGAPQAEP
jgi:hypothetical protein